MVGVWSLRILKTLNGLSALRARLASASTNH
jgi:hypothetical protein